jgi:hypothetical protein
MALVVKDRVKETTATTGTGILTLAGAVTGFQSFSSALSDGDTTYYAIFEGTTGSWEVGLGTFTASGTTLARTTILASSNSGSAVNLTAGAAEVFITQPAGKAAYFDGSGDLNLTRDPQSALQAATKQYVDTIAAAGIHYHTPVRVESPTALTATYDNGTAGVGATLTNSDTPQEALVIDGITLSTSDRVLVYNQSNAAHNGIYTVTNTGSASTNWVLTRATDADSYGPSDPDALGEGDAFFVSEGNTGAGELYVMNTSGTITFGTTNITFAIVAETAVYAAGNGLTLTGTTFAVGAGTGVTVNTNDIAIGQDVGTTSNVTFNQVTAALVGNVTGNVSGSSGSTTGNAATATKLATSRTISLTGDVTGSASFDGSANASIAATIAADSVALGTDTTGNYVAAGAVSGNGLSGSASAEGATFTVTSNATNANTASTIVFRDGSGNFSAGTITAALNGNASTATSATNADTVDSLHASQFLRSDADDTTSGTITIDSTTQTSFNVEYANDGAGIGPVLRTFRDSASPAAEDSLGGIDFKGNNSAGTEKFYARIKGVITDPTDTSEDGAVEISVSKAGTAAWETSALVAKFDANGMELRGDIIFEGSTANNSETTLTVTDPTADRTITLPDATGTVWTSGNDGSGSGLDADTTDGYQASESSTGSTLAARNSSGDLYMRYGVSSYLNMSHSSTTRSSDTIFYSSTDNYIRKNNATGFKTSLGLNSTDSPSFAGLNINGNLNAVDNIYVASSIFHEGDTDTRLLFGTDTITLVAGGSNEITVNTTGVRLGDTGNGYFQPVTGNYGSVQVDGGAHGGWEGYSIGGRAVFMHNNSTSMGLYDDVNNHWALNHVFNGATSLYYDGSSKLATTSTGVNIDGDLNAVDNIYVANAIYHEGDTNTYVSFGTDIVDIRAGGVSTHYMASTYTSTAVPFYNYSIFYEDYDALSGTSVTVNCNTAQAFSLTMTGNTTFAFNSVTNAWSTGFVLELTGNGGTITWPTSVDWAGGTAPAAPASGETDIYVFWTRDGGTTWYGALAIDAAA